MKPIPLIFYYHRLNRYSFNALAGALDSDPQLADYPVVLARTPDELKAAADSAADSLGRIIVGFSVLTPQLPEMRRLARQLRQKHGTRVLVMAGGPHVTADPGAVLESGIDIAFQGEAELSLPAVLGRLVRGEDFRNIAGIAIRDGDRTVVHRRGRPVDMDACWSFSASRGMFGPVEITRGCPFACSFCQTSHIFGVRPRHRGIARIVEHAAALPTGKSRDVRLLSPNAFSYGSPDGRQLNLPAITDLLSSVRRALSPGDRIIFGYFPSEVRPEHVSVETLELLRRFADNDEIVIGAQSGSDRMLEACRRGHSVADVLRAVSLAKKYGYKIIVDLILGLPGETGEDVRQTVAVIAELSRMGARVHPHAFVPLPQTRFAGERPGIISPEVIRALEQMRQRHAIYGDWVEQRRLAGRIYRGLKTGRWRGRGESGEIAAANE